jgi:hypothetical protein
MKRWTSRFLALGLVPLSLLATRQVPQISEERVIRAELFVVVAALHQTRGGLLRLLQGSVGAGSRFLSNCSRTSTSLRSATGRSLSATSVPPASECKSARGKGIKSVYVSNIYQKVSES